MAGKSVGSVDDLIEDIIGQKGMGRAGFYSRDQEKQMQQHIRENLAPVLQRYYSHSSHLAEEITEQACWYMWEEGYEPGSGSHLQADPFQFLQRLMKFYDAHSSEICSFDCLDAITIVRKVRPALEAWMSRPGETPRKDPWPDLTVLVEKLSAVASTAPGNPDVLCFLADNIIHLKEKAVPPRSPFTWKATDKFFDVYHKWIRLLRIDQGGVGAGLTKETAILYDLPIPRLESELTAVKLQNKKFDNGNLYWSTRTPEGIEILTGIIDLCSQYHPQMAGLSFSSAEILDGARKFRSGQIPNLKYNLNGLKRFFNILIQQQCQTVEEAAECAALDISDYQVCRKLGEGVYKKVYLGVNTFSAEEKALKIVEVSARGEVNIKNRGLNLETFVREEAAKSVRVKRINSPHLATVEDIRYEPRPGKFVIYEELLDETLSEARPRSKETRSTDLWKERVVLYAAQIAAGLSALHEHNLIHGDLTLSNIGIKDGKVKITDFGLASTLGNLAQEIGERTNVGSILTRAPELFSGAKATDKSDVWSFGVIVYALMAGTYPPFLPEGERPQGSGEKRMAFEEEVKRRIEETDLGSIYATFPGRIKHTLKACLQKDPRQRRAMAEIYDSLRKWYLPFQIHYSEECNQWVGDWKNEWKLGRPSPVPASELWFLPFSREKIGGYRVIFVIDQRGEILCYDGENNSTLNYRSEQPHYLLGTFESPSLGHALRCFMVRSRKWEELDVYNEFHRSVIGPTRSLIFSHPQHREMLENYLVDVNEILADQI